MTKKRNALSNYRMNRRKLMLASAAGATLLSNREAAAVPPGFKGALQKAAEMLISRCERTCELLGDVKVSQLLGGVPEDPDTDSRAESFATILASRNDDLPDGDGGTEVENLIKQLNLAEEPIYYRDFFTKSKEEWGGSAADGIVAAMKAGEDLFI